MTCSHFAQLTAPPNLSTAWFVETVTTLSRAASIFGATVLIKIFYSLAPNPTRLRRFEVVFINCGDSALPKDQVNLDDWGVRVVSQHEIGDSLDVIIEMASSS